MEVITTDQAMTTPQRVRFAQLEENIENKLQAFYDVGEALNEIRESRLYRAEHGTFAEYVQAKWGFARQHAYRLIASSKVLDNIEPTEEQRENLRETHLRPLATLPPSEQKQAFNEAIETAPDGQLTQKHVHEVVQEKTGQTVRMKAERGPVEWYTPEHVIEAAAQVMGDFDLDPASCANANRIVNALKFYTLEDNGLEQPWTGRVWLNPPYDAVGPWVEKLIAEYEAGNVTEAVLLVNANTETRWFEKLWKFSICFVRGRLKFWNPEKANAVGAPHGNAVIYVGAFPERFSAEFQKLGTVYAVKAGQAAWREISNYQPEART